MIDLQTLEEMRKALYITAAVVAGIGLVGIGVAMWLAWREK